MSITNPQIAQSISDLIDKWWTREHQYQDWLAGIAAGGPYADGRYPLTDSQGVTHYVTCPAALQAQVDGPSGSAATHAADAAASATSAGGSATAAAGSATAAAGSASTATTQAGLATNSQSFAANSASAAQVYKNSAKTSADASAASAASIVGDKDAAAASAANALTSEANAASSEAASATSASQSASSSTLAGKYANNPEDVIVTGSDYSAYHWAQKARAYSTGTLIYKGSLDASAAFPSSPRQGDFYIVSNAGGAYHVGDMVVYDGSAWDRIDNQQTVTSVAGRVGAITLNSSDVGLDSVLNAAQLVAANNLSDLPNKGVALGNLGAYDKGSVDTLLAGKADKDGPAFTGIVVMPGTSGPSFSAVQSEIPYTGALYFGDGTGWKFPIRVASSGAIVATFSDTGDLVVARNISAGNLSGTNTGDETLASIKSKLGISTLSGSNTGDQDLQGLFCAPATGSYDWNTLTSPAISGKPLQLGTEANGPGQPAYFYPFVVTFGDKMGGSNLTQLALPYTDGNGIYYRDRYAGTWTVWKRVWDSGSFDPATKANLSEAAFTGNVSGVDFTASRPGGTTGIIYLGSSYTRYLYYDGASYQMPGASLLLNGVRVPAIFVQSTAPSATAVGDLWVW